LSWVFFYNLHVSVKNIISLNFQNQQGTCTLTDENITIIVIYIVINWKIFCFFKIFIVKRVNAKTLCTELHKFHNLSWYKNCPLQIEKKYIKRTSYGWLVLNISFSVSFIFTSFKLNDEDILIPFLRHKYIIHPILYKLRVQIRLMMLIFTK